jgi:hypothetical protein
MLRPMANVIVVEILRFLTKRAEQHKGVKLPRPVGIVIDEFASALGRLPDIHVKLNTLRSRNVSIVAAIQSTAQIKANYADDADSVLAGFSTKIFMPNLDLTDSEWASKESGQMTIRFKTQSEGVNRKLIEVFASRNDSVQEQVQQRAVLTPDEIGKPADNICTFFMPGTPVFQGHLIPFYKIPEMHKRMTEFNEDNQLELRDSPIEYKETLPDPSSAPAASGGGGGGGNALPNGITNTAGWSDAQVLQKLEEVKKTLDKVLKYTPSKGTSAKKETPQKPSAKKSTTGGKKQTPALPSPGGKKSTKTTDQMTMAQFKKYLDWHEKKKGGKVLGKRSTAGKASAASGKASKASKKSVAKK